MGRIVAVPIIGNALRFVFFLATGGRSSNGRTPDSGSGYLGSNPSLPAKRPIAPELHPLAQPRFRPGWGSIEMLRVAPDNNGCGISLEYTRVLVKMRISGEKSELVESVAREALALGPHIVA